MTDPMIQRIIDRLVEEEGFNRNELEKSLIHFFSWQREAFRTISHKEYLWHKFGVFSVIDKRLKRKLQKQLNNGKENKTDENKSKKE